MSDDTPPSIDMPIMFQLVRNNDALRAENERLREALEWYAAESDEKFQIVDSKGEAIANFASFTSRARAALKD